MASPQLENGYVRIANELFEAIYKLPFNGNQVRVILWVIRNSYGWQRCGTQPTTARALAEGIGMSKTSAHLALKVLVEQGVLYRGPQKTWRLQKDYERWMNGESNVPPAGQIPKAGQKRPKPGTKTSRIRDKSPSDVKTVKTVKTTTTAAKAAGAPSKGEYKVTTDLQRIICGYKVCLGIKFDDRDWDAENFKVWSRAGKKLIRAFRGVDAAIDWLGSFSETMDKAERTWTLATAARIAHDEKGKRKTEQDWEKSKRSENDHGHNAGPLGAVKAV